MHWIHRLFISSILLTAGYCVYTAQSLRYSRRRKVCSMERQVGLPLVSFQEVMTEDLTPVDWLVTDLIANQDRVVLYGEPGAMKSWLLLHLAVHLAAGRPWLGRFEVPMAREVLYIDEEMNVGTLRRRIKQIGGGANLGAENLPLRLLSLHGVRFDETGAQTLLNGLTASAFDPEVIIVETLRRVMHGSENDAEEVAAFWRNLEPLRKAGKTVIISHHMRKLVHKGVNDPQYRASGSTDIIAGTDTAIAITKVTKGLTVVECVKSRNADEYQNFRVVLVDQPLTQAIEMQFGGLVACENAVAGQLDRAMSFIVEFLSGQPEYIAKPAPLEAHVVGQGISARTFSRARTDLKKKGGVVKVPGQGWQLTEEFRPKPIVEPVAA
jgi:hypothetical protein